MDYTIRFEILGVYNKEYTEEDISLGTAIKETFDKSYDMAQLELLLTDYPKEYQPYTPCRLTILTYNEEKITSTESYDMLIESDNVEDVYIGEDTRYTHRLVLIEKTKRLETELMPNMTFTQPVKVIGIDTNKEFLTDSEIEYGPNTVKTSFEADWATSFIGFTLDTQYTTLLNAVVEDTSPSYRPGDQKISRQFFTGANFPVLPIYPFALTPVNIYDPGSFGNDIGEIIVGNTSFGVSAELAYVRFNLYPSSVTIYNDSYSKTIYGNKLYSTKPSNMEIEYSYMDAFTIPEDIPSGIYNIRFNYTLTKFKTRELLVTPSPLIVAAPIMVWRDYKDMIDLDKDSTTRIVSAMASGYANSKYTVSLLDGSREEILNMREYINKYSYLEYKNVEIKDTHNASDILRDSYSLSELLRRIESQVNMETHDLVSEHSGRILTTGYNSLDLNSNAQTLDISFDYTSTTSISSRRTSFAEVINFLDSDGNIILTQDLSSTSAVLGKAYTRKHKIAVPSGTSKISFLARSAAMVPAWYTITEHGSTVHRYKFSDDTYIRANNILCPEFTFEGKTLWEICNEIGEVLHGIPYLNTYDEISYLYQDENEPEETPYVKESEVKSSSMTNYATRLFTPNLKNIINDTDSQQSVTYPDNNLWATVRASSYNETSINRTSSVLHIDNESSGIYAVTKFLIKTKVDGKDFTYDMTDRLLEKEIWNTLSSNISNALIVNEDVAEKALYFYYEKGGKDIFNLAQLPENKSAIGWKQTKLSVQYALAKKFNLDVNKFSKNIFDYQFQLSYIPYTSRMNIASQSNLNDIYNQVTINFNQTSNNVSSKSFAELSQNTLNKLGNSDITTRYTSDRLDDIDVGDMLVINNRNYYVNTKALTLGNNDVSVEMNLTKDNYKQNDRIAVSKEYRQYNIDSKNVIRKTQGKFYTALLSTELLDIESGNRYTLETGSNKTTIRRSIYETLEPSKRTIRPFSLAFLKLLNEDGTPLKYNTYRNDVTASTVKNKLLPLSKDVLGNTITLQWNMYDNYSAGRIVRDTDDLTDNWWNNLELTIGDPNDGGIVLKEKYYGIKIQDDARYCDDNGSTPRVYCEFISTIPQSTWNIAQANNLPDTTLTSTSSIKKDSIALDYMSYKDSREALSCQLNIVAQTFDKDIAIGNLMEYNPMILETSENVKWYGYTYENAPLLNQKKYTPNSDMELEVATSLSEDRNIPYIRVNLYNRSGDAYAGAVLCSSNGSILINLKKKLYPGLKKSLYISILNDNPALSDIGYKEDENVSQYDISDFKPVVFMSNDKLYADLSELEGSILDDVRINLYTKHNTRPRGIKKGYKSRVNAKHPKGSSLYTIGNNYCDNDGKFLFNRIEIDKQTGELFYTIDDERHNLIDYLRLHRESKQDKYGGSNTVPAIRYKSDMSYGIILKYKDSLSNRSNNIVVRYDNTTRMPLSITTMQD